MIISPITKRRLPSVPIGSLRQVFSLGNLTMRPRFMIPIPMLRNIPILELLRRLLLLPMLY